MKQTVVFRKQNLDVFKSKITLWQPHVPSSSARLVLIGASAAIEWIRKRNLWFGPTAGF